MLKATKGKILPTAIIGSLPRPSWYTENLGTRSFVDAMANNKFREQYVDALACYLRDQEVAGLDVVTDGDCRFDQDVGGQTWTSYPPRHMSGFEATHPQLAAPAPAASVFRADTSCTTIWKRASCRRSSGRWHRGNAIRGNLESGATADARPFKFGTVAPELVAYAVQDEHYKDLPSRIMALSDAFNKELHDLADAGCPVIQIEDPQLHLLAARPVPNKDITLDFMLKVFNNTVKGLRDKTEVWCHTCWGNPSQQRMFAQVQSYKPALEVLNQVDADLITFEMKSSNALDLEPVCKQITGKEDRDRRDRSPHIAGRKSGRSRRPPAPGAQVPAAGTPRRHHGLRDGPRRNEPPPRFLQIRCSCSRNEHRAQRTGRA